MKVFINTKTHEENIESDSVTRGRARRQARKARRSGTKPAASKPAAAKKPTAKKPTANKKPAAKPKTGGAVKAKKPVKIPNSVELLVQRAKPKLRIFHAESGRYVLTGRGVKYAIVRFKEETKYMPSMGAKLFRKAPMESKSSAINVEDDEIMALMNNIGEGEYSEPVEELEAELEMLSARAPGARSQQAGQKLGRKRRAANMMPPGWHMFKEKDGKITREYVGPRMSARRLINIASGQAGGVKDDKKDSKKPASGKATEGTSLDRKAANSLKKEIAERGIEDAKIRRSTKEGSMTVTYGKGDRTKMTGAINRLKKSLGGKVEVVREMKGDKVVATIKPKTEGKQRPSKTVKAPATKQTSKPTSSKKGTKGTLASRIKKNEEKLASQDLPTTEESFPGERKPRKVLNMPKVRKAISEGIKKLGFKIAKDRHFPYTFKLTNDSGKPATKAQLRKVEKEIKKAFPKASPNLRDVPKGPGSKEKDGSLLSF